MELPEVSAFVLAGGKSSRMGRDKALLEFEGEPLIARALRTLRLITPEVAIAGGDAGLARYAPVVEDLYPGQGPLGGIVSALGQSERAWSLFLAVDMPFVDEGTLRGVLSGIGPEVQGVLAEYAGVTQPLCAVYARAALPVLRRELEAGNRRVRAAIEATGHASTWLAPTDVFANLNTPGDLWAARGNQSVSEQ